MEQVEIFRPDNRPFLTDSWAFGIQKFEIFCLKLPHFCNFLLQMINLLFVSKLFKKTSMEKFVIFRPISVNIRYLNLKNSHFLEKMSLKLSKSVIFYFFELTSKHFKQFAFDNMMVGATNDNQKRNFWAQTFHNSFSKIFFF